MIDMFAYNAVQFSLETYIPVVFTEWKHIIDFH